MTRDELYSYLADPKRLTAETLEPIRALYESYPYCAPFAFLYLYNLSLTGDVRYASELRRLSVLLPDREQLFRLVEGNRPAFVAATLNARSALRGSHGSPSSVVKTNPESTHIDPAANRSSRCR